MSLFDLYSAPLSAYTPGQGDLSMEGGWQTASGAPMTTLEMFLRGQAPYVTGATSSKPTGEIVYRKVGDSLVPIKLSDYGPGVKGIDVAVENPQWATNFPYQGQTDSTMIPQNLMAQYTPPTTTYGGSGPMDTMDFYKNVIQPEAPTPTSSAFSIIGKGLASIGRGMASAPSQNPLSALQQPHGPVAPVAPPSFDLSLLAPLLQRYFQG